MGRLLKKIKNIWENKFGYILALTILNYSIFGIMRYSLGRYVNYPFYTKILKFSSALYIFFMFFMTIYTILNLINKRISNFIFKIFMFISYILFIIDFLILKQFKLYISTSTLQILSETNKNETSEFFKTYFDIYNIIMVLVLVGLIFLISKIKVKIKSPKLITFLLIATIVQIGLYKENIKVMQRIPVGRVVLGLKDVQKNKQIYKELENKMNSNVTITKNDSNIEDIVFIIGESTTRNHMGLYNYSKNTNPLLKKLELQGNLFAFNDVISPHGYTMASLQKVLTFYDLESQKPWYKYNNILDVMKAANYNTYWFSNQDSNGLAANIGKRADLTLFNQIVDDKDFETRNGFYDGQIVDKSEDKIKKERNFVIYHLIGTHSEFKKRYPEEFDKFSSDEYKNDLSDKKKNTLATYDNAILYNDYVVNKIINLFKDNDSIVIYISDHAEDLYELGYKGHGEGRLSRYTVEIPMTIYVSNKFKELHPEIIKKIKSSLNKPYMTDDIIHMILDIAEIETPEFDKTKSIINEDFNENRNRILKGKSYDKYYKIKQ